MTTTIRGVGFIGLGDQGGPMAEAIGERGFALHVWARRPAALSAVERVPHTVHGTVAELGASAELVGLCLRDDADIWDVLDGQGLLAAIAPGTITVNHGTGDPSEVLQRGLAGAAGLVGTARVVARARRQAGAREGDAGTRSAGTRGAGTFAGPCAS
ncbi:NAD(P)-binding domain-containing protein [Streptomyces sp. NPDC001980]|uniref:NAD(P)-binding domain-containing protein n=1 Tax=Streptomyces sp. NPDC001980 TaxID=3157126 RepID=UPI00331BE6AA